jgi:anti-sigma B factor antagonist
MDLETKKSDDIVFLKPLKQNIDATASTQFKARVMDLINQGNNFFLLNLSDVEFVDSSGLGAMISILKTLKLNNGDIVLCNLNMAVLNLFNLTRMNNVFNIRSNEKEGLEALLDLRKKLSAHQI